MSDQVVSHESALCFEHLGGSAGMMRLHNHTVKIEKAVVNVEFVPGHIEAGAATGRFGQSMVISSPSPSAEVVLLTQIRDALAKG